MRTRAKGRNLGGDGRTDGKKQRMMKNLPIGMIRFSWDEPINDHHGLDWNQVEATLVTSFNQEDTVPEIIPFFVVTAYPDRKYPTAQVLHGRAKNLVCLREKLCMSLCMRVVDYLDFGYYKEIKEELENIELNENGEQTESRGQVFWTCVNEAAFGDYGMENPLWKYSIFWKGQWITLHEGNDHGWGIRNKIELVDINNCIDLVHDECRLSRALRGLEEEACDLTLKLGEKVCDRIYDGEEDYKIRQILERNYFAAL